MERMAFSSTHARVHGRCNLASPAQRQMVSIRMDATRYASHNMATSHAACPKAVPTHHAKHPSCLHAMVSSEMADRPTVDLPQQEPALPATYKRLVAKSAGSSFREVAQVVEAAMPTPGPGEVLVRIHFAGINGGCETFRVRGEFAFSANRHLQGFPLGAEGCGVVAALGPDVSTLKVGQTVAVNGCSSFAEYCIAKVQLCTAVAGPPSAEAVALVLSAVTAAVALEATAKLQPGEAVAVTAAAGGTGHFAVQLALAAGCSTVVAVCGSDTKAAALQLLDPRVHTINYKDQDLQTELSRLCPAGLDVVYEGVGGNVQRVMRQHLAPTGRLLQVGYISEYPHTNDYAQQQPQQQPQEQEDQEVPCSKLFWEGLTLNQGGQQIIGKIWPKDIKAIARSKRKVFKMYEQGQLQVWIDRTKAFKGLASIPDAIDHMLMGGHMGKVVVEI